MPPSATDLDGAVHRQEFADHVILRPPNRLKQRAAKLVDDKGREAADPVRRAENALDLLSNEFEAWMLTEVDALEAARTASIDASDLSDLAALFRVSHDIRGQAATLGYPLIGMIADGLCDLIDRPRDAMPPQRLIDLHVDTIKAMVRENARTRDDLVGAALVQRLKDLRADAIA